MIFTLPRRISKSTIFFLILESIYGKVNISDQVSETLRGLRPQEDLRALLFIFAERIVKNLDKTISYLRTTVKKIKYREKTYHQ